MVPGAYRLRDYRYAITAVLTNKCPAGPYRAPMLICSWVTEGTIDTVARALDLDPVAVRRKNMLAESDLPYTTATRLVYRSVYPRDTLERALEAFGLRRSARSRDDARAAGRIAGIGRGHLHRAEHVRLGVLQDGRHRRIGPTTPRSSGSSRAAASRRRSASSARARGT